MRIPLLAAIILVVLSVLTDLYILRDIRQYSPGRRSKVSGIVYIVLSVLLWAFLVVVMCLPRQDEDKSILPVMWMLFSYLSVYVMKIIYVVCSLIGRIFARRHSRKLNAGGKVGICLGVLMFIVMWWGVLFTRHDIVVNNVDLTSEKLPRSFDGFKLVQFSDAHVGTWGNDTTFISELVDSINATDADMIVFTGDIVNRRSSELKPFKSVLSRLRAPYGVYAILGNHDYAGYVKWKNPGDANEDVRKLSKDIEEMGWKLLKNQTDFVRIGNDSIVIIGVENWGEPPFNQLGDLGKSYPESKDRLHGLNDDMYKILLTHNPQHWTEEATNISNIDLSLAGHTHAMQMMLKFGDWKWSPAVFRYKQWGGLYGATAGDGNPMSLYVNTGVGEVGFPARIGAAKPEITTITLHTK